MLFLQVFVRTLGGQIFQNSNEVGEFCKEWEGVLPQFYNEGGEIRNEGGAPPLWGGRTCMGMQQRGGPLGQGRESGEA